ncbi:alpha/beta hydrolase [Flavobacterium sp.]|uniref:alpha/beta hydrolase n=1 Tax=Flavobacterium sp. TaxID=239 RepID=UPI003751A2BB
MNKFLFILLITTLSFSQESTILTQEIEINPLIKGTLFSPEKVTKKTKLVILIAGSGPTNRNGNQVGMSNNSLKYLAEGLAKNGIAVFSYDKRIIALTIANKVDEKSLRFDDMITDATSVFNYFKSQKKYKKIIIAGHSEGSLVGMIAANKNADAFVSLAGAGRPIDEVLNEQFEKNYPKLSKEVKEYLLILKSGNTFELKSKDATIASVFRESVQPYLISCIKYNSQAEIKKLSIPVFLINGTKDLQVPQSDAQLLKVAYPKAQINIIENMNHIFKEIINDDDNLKSYSNPKTPIMPELIDSITKFVTKL